MAKKKEMDKLSREVSQALAAGMSYGKWKAMQDPVKIEPKPDLLKYATCTCAYCGAEFVMEDQRSRKYCGTRCRRLANCATAREKYKQERSGTNA